MLTYSMSNNTTCTYVQCITTLTYVQNVKQCFLQKVQCLLFQNNTMLTYLNAYNTYC